MTMRRRHIRRHVRRHIRAGLTAAAAAPLLGLLGSLTACGGSDDGGAVASAGGEDKATAEASADPVAEAQAYADCLREEGLEVEDPDPETGEIDLSSLVEDGSREAMTEAFDACRHLAPEQFAGDAELTEEQRRSMQEFAECMRGEGVDMEDPGPQGLEPGQLDVNDPAAQDALEVCEGEVGWRR